MVSTIVMYVTANMEAYSISARTARALQHLLSTATTDNTKLCITELGLEPMTYHFEGDLPLLTQFEHLRLDELAANLIDGRIEHESPLGAVLPILFS